MIISELIKTIQTLEITINSQVTETFVGNYSSAFRGRGSEIAEIREYSPSDTASDIDWITTSKTNKLHVRTYHETRELSVMLFIDVSSKMNFGSTVRTKKQILLELVTILCFSTLKNNDKIGAILFTDRIVQIIPSKKGTSHIWYILRQILIHYEQNKNTFAKLENVLPQINKLLSKKCVGFLLSDYLVPTKCRLLTILNKKHDITFLQINDSFETGEFLDHIISVQDPITQKQFVLDCANDKFKKKYKINWNKKDIQIKKFLQTSLIPRVCFQQSDNLYKKLLIFFQKKQRI